MFLQMLVYINAITSIMDGSYRKLRRAKCEKIQSSVGRQNSHNYVAITLGFLVNGGEMLLSIFKRHVLVLFYKQCVIIW